MIRVILIAVGLAGLAGEARAQGRAAAAREAAELLIGRFGAKAGRSVPELAGRIEGIAARYGDEAVLALRKGGPSAVNLVEAAGVDGAKAIRVLATHGELGASRVLSRPAAMRQFLAHGDDAAAALVKHPGVAEDLVEKAGLPAAKALAAVGPQSGRRVAMVLEGELAGQAARHPELLGLIARHGDRAVNFIWQNKAVLAGGAALAAFLADPEPFLSGAAQLTGAAGEAVVKPVVSGAGSVLTTLLWALVGLGVTAGVAAAVVLVKRPELATAAIKSLVKK